jgi:hypothetical protein
MGAKNKIIVCKEWKTEDYQQNAWIISQSKGGYGTSETRMEARTGDRGTLDIRCWSSRKDATRRHSGSTGRAPLHENRTFSSSTFTKYRRPRDFADEVLRTGFRSMLDWRKSHVEYHSGLYSSANSGTMMKSGNRRSAQRAWRKTRPTSLWGDRKHRLKSVETNVQQACWICLRQGSLQLISKSRCRTQS